MSTVGCDTRIADSSPIQRADFSGFRLTCQSRNGDVAQLAERYLCKVDVRGSIPLVSTRCFVLEPVVNPGFRQVRPHMCCGLFFVHFVSTYCIKTEPSNSVYLGIYIPYNYYSFWRGLTACLHVQFQLLLFRHLHVLCPRGGAVDRPQLDSRLHSLLHQLELR